MSPDSRASMAKLWAFNPKKTIPFFGRYKATIKACRKTDCLTDVDGLKKLPPKNEIEKAKLKLERKIKEANGKEHIISWENFGQFNKSGLERMMHLFECKQIAVDVKSENKWVQMQHGHEHYVAVLCTYDWMQNGIETYKSLYPSDFSYLFGDKCLSDNLLITFTDIMNKDAKDDRFIMWQPICSMNEEFAAQLVKESATATRFHIMFSLKRVNATTVKIVEQDENAFHFSYLYIDLYNDNYTYADSSGYAPPENLTSIILPFVNSLRTSRNMTPLQNFRPRVTHIAIQSCGTACGLCVMMCCAAALDKGLHQYLRNEPTENAQFFEDKYDISSWKQVSVPSSRKDSLRCTIINWLYSGKVSLDDFIKPTYNRLYPTLPTLSDESMTNSLR